MSGSAAAIPLGSFVIKAGVPAGISNIGKNGLSQIRGR
jgi:hypothetical protein